MSAYANLVIIIAVCLPLLLVTGSMAETVQPPHVLQAPSLSVAVQEKISAKENEAGQVNISVELLKGGINAIPVLLAAFLGPWFAFRMQNRHEQRKDKNEEFKAGLRAQLVLYEQVTSLCSLKKNMLQKYEKDSERWLSLPPIIAFLPKAEIDMSQLYFLNQRGSNQLHVELVVAQANYFIAVKSFESRNAKHNQYQTLLLKKGKDQISDANLVTSTDEMFQSVYDSIPVIVNAINSLGKFLVVQYGSKGVIRATE
jgi:hypothetical protein